MCLCTLDFSLMSFILFLMSCIYLSVSIHSFIHSFPFIFAATRENRSSEFPTRSDTNRSAQSQKQLRSL